MENRIKNHQETQDLRCQVSELMEHALNNGRLVEKLRSMIFDLLVEHENKNTYDFRKNKIYNK